MSFLLERLPARCYVSFGDFIFFEAQKKHNILNSNPRALSGEREARALSGEDA